jgi:hypothetical protein
MRLVRFSYLQKKVTMFHPFVWVTVMMFVLALGITASRAEEGQDHHHGKLYEACKADTEKFCKDTKGDRGAMRKCMQDHEKDLSDGCKKAREEMKTHRRDGSKQGEGVSQSGT